jgi:alpha-tubulin suppressor-like RCC1 family protein
LTASGTVACWGKNNYGQLGRDTVTFRPEPEPQKVLGLDHVISITAGGNHACALTHSHRGE